MMTSVLCRLWNLPSWPIFSYLGDNRLACPSSSASSCSCCCCACFLGQTEFLKGTMLKTPQSNVPRTASEAHGRTSPCWLCVRPSFCPSQDPFRSLAGMISWYMIHTGLGSSEWFTNFPRDVRTVAVATLTTSLRQKALHLHISQGDASEVPWTTDPFLWGYHLTGHVTEFGH